MSHVAYSGPYGQLQVLEYFTLRIQNAGDAGMHSVCHSTISFSDVGSMEDFRSAGLNRYHIEICMRSERIFLNPNGKFKDVLFDASLEEFACNIVFST